MKKMAILILALMMVSIGFLCGCNQQATTKSNYNIGESIVVENIRYTFLSAEWVESWGSYSYKLTIKGENLGTSKATGIIAIIRYTMENGYTYEHNIMYDGLYGTTFTINPGKEQTLTITSYSGEIDRDFLPVAKISLDFRKENSNALSFTYIKSVVLNV